MFKEEKEEEEEGRSCEGSSWVDDVRTYSDWGSKARDGALLCRDSSKDYEENEGNSLEHCSELEGGTSNSGRQQQVLHWCLGTKEKGGRGFCEEGSGLVATKNGSNLQLLT